MGKDDKQRRKGQSASSSRAAELLQSSGLGIQFLNLGGNDSSTLEFPSIDENASEEFGDVDPEFRIAFRKLSKREANTREKGLKTLAELIQNADVNSHLIINGIRHFVKFYNYLVFDSVSGIRVAANEAFMAAILKLRKQIVEQIVKMLSSTLISLSDPLVAVRRSASELLEKGFDDDQRKKIYERTSSKAVKICLQLIQKKNSLVTKQKYEDHETLQQRSDRIIIQAFTALGELSKNSPELIGEILGTIDASYDSVTKMGPHILNSLLICILQMLKDNQIDAFMRTNTSFKILKLLDSENDALSKNAFGCYLFMTNAIADRKIDTLFSKHDFIENLILRMVTNKGRHFNALQESLLPLIIVAIKSEKEAKPFAWILEVMEAFFEGEVTNDLYLIWSNTFIDVSNWLYKTFLPSNFNEEFVEKLDLLTLEFVQLYADKTSDLSLDVRVTVEKLYGDFIVYHLSLNNAQHKKLADHLVNLLIDASPSISSLIAYVLLAGDKLPKSERHHFEGLAAKALINCKTPDVLFKQFIEAKCYVGNSQLDETLLIEKLIDVLKSGELADEYLECYKYLQEQGICDQYKLSDIIDLNVLGNLTRVIRVFSHNIKHFSADERLVFLRTYTLSFANRESNSENPWTDEFLAWIEENDIDTVYSLIIELHQKLSLRLYVKLILALDSSKLTFNKQQCEQIASLTLTSIFTFNDSIDRLDAEKLDKFLETSSVDLTPYVTELFKQLKSTKACDSIKWNNIGLIFNGLQYIANSFEIDSKEFSELTEFLDSTFGEQILLNETMLVTASLSKFKYKALDVDGFSSLVKCINTASFYIGSKSEHVNVQLYICLSYAMLKLYTNGSIIQNELCRQIPQFMQFWDEIVNEWNMTNVCQRIIYKLVASSDEIPFTVLYMLRQLKAEFKVGSLSDSFAISTLDSRQKLRAISALSFNLPHELLPEDDYLHFVNSLEKSSQKLMGGAEDQIDIALITLADLRSKIESDSFDGLFSVVDDDPIKSGLSCAVLRTCTFICQVLPDIDSSIRDFILCGLVTAAENFSTHFRSQGPIRLLAVLASKFFLLYDDSLTKTLDLLNSSVISSVEVMERRSKIGAIQHEWRDFFGASMGNYLMAWFCWVSSTSAKEDERFPEFLRIQLCKFVYNANPKLGLFKMLHNPTALFGQLGDAGSNLVTKDIFEMLVELLFSDHPELQLTSIQILQSELISILDEKKNALDENTQIILALREEEETAVESENEPQVKDIEYKLFEFFTSLMERLANIEWTNVNALDSWLALTDLLLRIVRLLDSQTSAAFCSELRGEAIHSMLFRICSYINFNEDSNTVKQFASLTPASFFTLWKQNVDLRNKEAMIERLISIEGYSCWLYRRALETLPSLARDWFVKANDNRLKSYTQQNISPILVENEMSKVGNQTSAEGFTMRARPNTHEIFVKYKIDEAALELTLSLPEDYPLEAAIIHHDKRPNILVNNLTNTLHKNLFAFINNRNGSLLEGIHQWRRSVEKQVEGVEPCSICLMTVSTNGYRLPNLKCRTCKNKFHSDCMLTWMKTSQKPNCPLCRAEFN